MSQDQLQLQPVPQGQPVQREPSPDLLAWGALQDLQELRALQALQELLELQSLVRLGRQLRDLQGVAQQV